MTEDPPTRAAHRAALRACARAGNIAYNALSNITRQEIAFAELLRWVAKDKPSETQVQQAIQAVKDHFSNPESAATAAMNQYPPGDYIGLAMKKPPTPGADVPPQTVIVNAGTLWGQYRITFVAKRNPRQGMRNLWFWTMQPGERIDLAE